MFSQSACRANNAANGIHSDDTYDKDLEATGFGTKGYEEGEYSFGKKEDVAFEEIEEEEVYRKDGLVCIERTEEYFDPSAAHPIIEVSHRTYYKDGGTEIKLSAFLGMDKDTTAEMIREHLRCNYPELYSGFWGDPNKLLTYLVGLDDWYYLQI